MNGPLPLSWESLTAAAALVGLNGLLSLWLGLGLERRLAVASARTVVQLLLMGWLLTPIFGWNSPPLVALLAVMMVALAGREAVRRSSRTYRRLHLSTFGALAVSGGVTAVLATTVLIGVDPWWKPQYFIPLLGMILGNALTGISLGLDRCLTLLDEGRDLVEARLSMGATWWEAARPVASEAIRTGMIPIINSMSVVGLVTIPGMMTGQILGGTSPQLAARYQILIMFLIAAAVALGTGVAVLGSLAMLFDADHRLRTDWIRRKNEV